MDWFEDEEFWRATEGALFDTQAHELAPEQIDDILELVGGLPSLCVLDMPCGVGRHSLELARRGFAVTGVDRTAFYLDRARAEAEEEGLEVEWVKADMRTFARPDTYGLALNLFTSFGYFQDEADDARVLEAYWQSLVPGGALVMEMMGKEVESCGFHERDWGVMEDGAALLERRRITQDWTWMEVEWTILRGEEVNTYRYGHRLFGASDLRRLLSDVGFVDIAFYGDFDGRAYDQNAERLLVVARRPT